MVNLILFWIEWLVDAGHLNSISYQNHQQMVKPDAMPMDLTTLEPEIWSTDPDDYYQGRYCILNFIPSHPFNDGGSYPLHLEYRGLKPILHINNVEEICSYFKTVANFLMALVQRTLNEFIDNLKQQEWFLELPNYQQLLLHYQKETAFRIGLEIETCIDVKQIIKLFT